MTFSELLDSVRSLAREPVLDALAVLFPVACSGCGRPDRALCPRCEAALAPHPTRVDDGGDGPPVWAALEYSGVARAVLLAYKDRGRTDAVAALARTLRPSVTAALAARTGVVLVTVPSTRAAFRKRGYHPTALALRRAGFKPATTRGAVRLRRQGLDQAGLTAAQRAENRAGAFIASPRLAGRACLIVDDIVTSGATAREATRAIEAVGGRVVGVAAIAHTALRRARGRPQRP